MKIERVGMNLHVLDVAECGTYKSICILQHVYNEQKHQQQIATGEQEKDKNEKEEGGVGEQAKTYRFVFIETTFPLSLFQLEFVCARLNSFQVLYRSPYYIIFRFIDDVIIDGVVSR